MEVNVPFFKLEKDAKTNYLCCFTEEYIQTIHKKIWEFMQNMFCTRDHRKKDE